MGSKYLWVGEGVTGSELFEPDGTMATFVVPWHVPGTLRVSLRGGAGGRLPHPNGEAGGGARFGCALDVAPGVTLRVIAGYSGRRDPGTSLGPFFGGEGGSGSSSGGTASEVRTSADIADRIAVAGGGGGGATGGGYPAGVVGSTGGPNGSGYGGANGSQVAGGAAGAVTGGPAGTAGGFGAGGNGSPNSPLCGGGGGGWYGGGGGGRLYGTEFGGGGGSSWMDTAVCSDLTAGTDPSVVQGFVLFEWEHADPPVHASRQLGLGRGTRGLS